MQDLTPIIILILCLLLGLFRKTSVVQRTAREMHAFLSRPPITALCLFFVALAARLIFYRFNTDLTYGGVSILGTPFSDAQDWNDLAIDLSQGEGLTGNLTARRPMYAMLMACFYTWFGYSHSLFKTINMVSSALAVSFIYLVGQKVFNRLVGILPAILLSFSTIYIGYALISMSESTALLMFVLSLYLLLSGLERIKFLPFFLSGVLFALSNLTQTVTLLAFPGYLLSIFYLLKRKRISTKKTISCLLLFAISVCISLAPWLVRQKAVHGILSISDNTAECLYAASMPEFGNWTGAPGFFVRKTAKMGFEGIKEKYDYLMEGAIDQIREHPSHYMKNVSKSFVRYMNGLKIKEKGFSLSSALFLLLLFMFCLPKAEGRKEIIWLTSLTFGLALIQRIIPSHTGIFIILLGMILAIKTIGNRYSIILTNSLIFTGVGISLVGGAILERALILVEWLFVLFYFFSFYVPFHLLSKKLLKEDVYGSSYQRGSPMETVLKKSGPYITVIAISFFLVSGAKLLYLNYFKPAQPEIDQGALTLDQKQEILKKVTMLIPEAFHEDEWVRPTDFARPMDYKSHHLNHKKIMISKGKVTSYLYHFPTGKKIHHWCRLFFHRPYERTILKVRHVGYVMFPGKIPDSLAGKDFIFVGRMNVDTRFTYEGRVIVEGIAMIPYDTDNVRLDMENIRIADDPIHKMVLRYYQP